MALELIDTKLQIPGLGAAINQIIRLLGLTAGDPSQAERCVFTSAPVAVTDSAITVIDAAQDRSRTFSSALLLFTSGSGSGRIDLSGSSPTPTGSAGAPFLAGGGPLEINGAENIRNFKIIAETGQALSFTVMLFQAALFSGDVR